MGSTATNSLTHPEFVRFLATIEPDEHLNKAAVLYATFDEALEKVKARGDQLLQDRRDVDLAFAGVGVAAPPTDKERRQLLEQRSLIEQELKALPTQRRERAGECARAHLLWLARLYQLAMTAAARYLGQLAEPVTELNEARRKLSRDQSMAAGVAILSSEERVATIERGDRALADLRPVRERMEQAGMVARIAQHRAQTIFGQDVDLSQPHTWDSAVQRARDKASPGGLSCHPDRRRVSPLT